MQTFTRIGLVSTFAFVSSVWAEPMQNMGTTTDSLQSALTPLNGGAAVNPKEIRGAYLALHFLPAYAGEAKSHADAVNEFAANLPKLAGLRTYFVVEAKRDWTLATNEASSLIAIDAGNALAKELQVAITSPVTVVFDPAGRELFRWTGSGEHGHLSYATFANAFNKQSEAKALKEYNLPKGSRLAIEGYDPVSYFVGKPAKGSDKITSTWQGVEYRFASKENREKFNTDPDQYAPTYGGWCASAMGAKGTKVEIDPTNYKVKDGRLHLFYKDFFSDALKDWNKNEKDWEPKADRNWKKTTGEDARRGTK